MDVINSNEINELEEPKRKISSSSSEAQIASTSFLASTSSAWSVPKAPVLAAPVQATGSSDALLTEADDPFSSDKHDMIVRIFNFYKETVHRFPSAHQDQHDEDLLNRLILQCIGTTSRPAPWNRPSIYVSPYTPIKPSKMHINDLPKDCIVHLLEQCRSLQELVAKAFVCRAWVSAVAKIISGRLHSMKMFDLGENIELYKERALMQYNLARLDLAAGVRQSGDGMEDHIFVRSFCGNENNQVKDIFEVLFAKVTYLVLHTLNIDHAGLIRCMDKLTSITLFEPPDKQQNAIWEALNTAPELRHVHIFYANQHIPFEAHKMDFLTRIESFTLDNYTQGNLFDILKRLGPQLRCLQIGQFAQGDEVLKQLIEQNPEMVANLTQLSVRLDEKCMETAPYKEPYEKSYLVHKKILQLIVDHFTKLVYLDMEFASLMFYTDVIDSLSKLPNLTELRLATHPKKTVGGFLRWPTQRQLQSVANHRRQPTPLPNISKMYLVKTHEYDDYQFLKRLFHDQNRVSRMQTIQGAWEQENLFQADANVTNVFPGIEQVTFVLNGAILNYWTGFFSRFRRSMRNTIPPQYWLRLRLYNVAVAKMNEQFFARDEQDVAWYIRERNILNNARRALVDAGEQNRFDHDVDRPRNVDDESVTDMEARIVAESNQTLEANRFWQAAQNELRQNVPEQGQDNGRIDENPLQENIQRQLDDLRTHFIIERFRFERHNFARRDDAQQNPQPRIRRQRVE